MTDITLSGMAVCKVKIGNQEKVVTTHITVPASGTIAYDNYDYGSLNVSEIDEIYWSDTEITSPDEYQEISLTSYEAKFKEGNKSISELIQVFQVYLTDSEGHFEIDEILN